MNRSIRIPKMDCPHCGGELTGTMAASGPVSAPEPGDVSICLYCTGASVFTETGIRKPTAEELAEIELSAEVRSWRGRIRAVKRWMKREAT